MRSARSRGVSFGAGPPPRELPTHGPAPMTPGPGLVIVPPAHTRPGAASALGRGPAGFVGNTGSLGEALRPYKVPKNRTARLTEKAEWKLKPLKQNTHETVYSDGCNCLLRAQPAQTNSFRLRVAEHLVLQYLRRPRVRSGCVRRV